MTLADDLNDGLAQLARLLDDPQLEPNPGRSDWSTARAGVDHAHTLLETQVLARLSGAGAPLAAGAEVQAAAADAAGQVAATLHAAGNPGAALALLERAAGLATSMAQKSMFVAAQRDAQAFTTLVHARWLAAHGRSAEAAAKLEQVRETSREPLLRELAGVGGGAQAPRGAKVAAPAGRPVRSAPPLFRLNGFGVGLYGSRDPRGDGTSIATYCLTALWVPVMPISAYRIVRDGRSVGFISHEPLSGLARGFRAVVLATVAIAIVWGGVSKWQHSPERKAKRAIAAALVVEKKDPPAAAAAWDHVLEDWEGRVDAATLEPAADGVMRVAIVAVPRPLTPTGVEAAVRVVARYDRLTDATRAQARKRLAAALGGWADELGAADAAHARAGLRVLDQLAHVEPDLDLNARRTTLRRGLADALAASEPLGALHLYLQNGGDAKSLAAARPLLTPVLASASIVLELDDVADSWIGYGEKDPASADTARALRTAIDAARQRRADAARQKLLDEPEEAALRTALAQTPEDQELTVALAQILIARGDLAGATRLVQALGAPGLLVGGARVLLAQLAREAGDLAAAEKLLAGWLDWRLAPFQEAAQRYLVAQREQREKLFTELQAGRFDAELTPKVEGMDEQQRNRFVIEWMSDRANADPSLQILRTAWQRHLDVVPASLLLGQVRLERARTATGADKDSLLAGAEQAYLNVQSVAGDEPAYHIGLGQVYYRLGRVDDGEKEFASVSEGGDAPTLARLSETYRDLGISDKARALALRVVDDDKAPESLRDGAAVALSILAPDEDEKEKWLLRSKNEQSKLDLLHLQAGRLMREGKDAEADAKYAEVERGYARTSQHDSASANNQGLALLSRFSATGNLAHVDQAVRLHESAVRLDPSNALGMHNLANGLVYRGELRVLDGFVQLRTLRPDQGDTAMLLTALASGPQGEQVRAALRQDASVRRGLEMLRRTEALAPQDLGAYTDELDLLTLERDVDGQRALLARVTPLGRFSSADLLAGKQRWFAGEMDAALGRTTTADIERMTRVAATASASARTRAAASLLLGRDLERAAIIEHDPMLLTRAVEAERQAFALAPDLGSGSEVAAALLLVACEHAVADQEELTHAWRDAQRHGSIAQAAWSVATSAQGAAFLARLRAQPQLTEAVSLIADPEPSAFDWRVAWLAGDAARVKTWASAFDVEAERLESQIHGVLLADDEDALRETRFFAARGKSDAAPAPAAAPSR
jgi:hypothetical protein